MLDFLQAIGQLKFRGTSVLLRNQPSLKKFLRKLSYQRHKHELQNRFEISNFFLTIDILGGKRSFLIKIVKYTKIFSYENVAVLILQFFLTFFCIQFLIQFYNDYVIL